MKTRIFSPCLAVTTLLVAACSPDDPSRGVASNYADVVDRSYREALERARELQAAIDRFLDAPGEETLAAARAAWIAARVPYGQTEAYRFYGGPIDDEETGPEGRVNAWPLDESWIDAIVDRPEEYPAITPEALAELNEKGGEKNIATGYHAIEYLLWGRDERVDGAGARPFADYVGHERRRQYLRAVTALLVEDLGRVATEWEAGRENYRARFVAEDARVSVGRILTGIGSLAGAELSGERMTVPFDTRNQEEEHSCFSDNTHADLVANAKGIQNVYLGRWGDLDGRGVDEWVREKDAALDERIRTDLETAIERLSLIPAPFDRAIVEPAGREKVEAAIQALRELTDGLARAVTVLGVQPGAPQ